MLLIGTPSYNNTVTIHYLRSLLATLDVCRLAGVRSDYQPLSYESLITRARNCIANAFLRQEKYSHLLFIDSDIGFPADAAVRYLRSDKDVVCGIYPVKRLDFDRLRGMPGELPSKEAVAASLKYTVKLTPGCAVDKEFLVPAEYGSTGFMMIKRQVLVKMAQAYPELRYHGSYINSNDEAFDNWAFFDTLIDRDNLDYLPEDYAFCKRWTALGGLIHADTVGRFTHSGICDFDGDFLAHLKYFHASVKG